MKHRFLMWVSANPFNEGLLGDIIPQNSLNGNDSKFNRVKSSILEYLPELKHARRRRCNACGFLVQTNDRKPYHGINFIIAHDGFTLYDLVAYNSKVSFCWHILWILQFFVVVDAVAPSSQLFTGSFSDISPASWPSLSLLKRSSLHSALNVVVPGSVMRWSLDVIGRMVPHNLWCVKCLGSWFWQIATVVLWNQLRTSVKCGLVWTA